MSIVGGVYLERGRPVTVLVGWRQQRMTERLDPGLLRLSLRTPRNVLIEREDGTRVVRPFRGLRKPPTDR